MPDRPIIFSAPMILALLSGTKSQTRRLAWHKRQTNLPGGRSLASADRSPWLRVQPGDRLWVREAWALLPRNCYALPKTPAPDKDFAAYYRADFDRCGRPAWRPSIHMPRWASRLTLTVTDVRVQRLQEITEDDVLAEGCPIDPDYHDTSADGSAPHMVKIGVAQWRSPRGWYHVLWDHLHGAGAWDANPEVVALTFTVAQRNIDHD